ncbi:MAG: tetratricopeptide repeat protein, partial [Sedimenticola sp.]
MTDWGWNGAGKMPGWQPWGSGSVTYSFREPEPVTLTLEQEISQLLNSLEGLSEEEVNHFSATVQEVTSTLDLFLTAAAEAETTGDTRLERRIIGTLARTLAMANGSVSSHVALALSKLAELEPDPIKKYSLQDSSYRCFLHSKGPKHYFTLEARNNLSCYLINLDHHQEALPHTQAAYEGFRDHPDYGELHPETLKSRFNLAICQQTQGCYQEVLLHKQATYEGFLNHPKYGEQHPNTANIRSSLGASMNELGSHQEALPHHRGAYVSLRNNEAYGECHPETQIIRLQLANCLSLLNDHSEALPHIQEVYEILKHHPEYGEWHKDTLTARMLLGFCLSKLKHYQHALDHFEGILRFGTLATNLRGRTHQVSAITHYDWAKNNQCLSNYLAAIPHAQQAYALLIYQERPDQLRALQSRQHEAKCHLALDQLDQALPLLQQAIQETSERFGPYQQLIMGCQGLLLIHYLDHAELGRNPQWLRQLCRGMLESGNAHPSWHEYAVDLVPPLLRWAATDSTAVIEVGDLLSRLGHAF